MGGIAGLLRDKTRPSRLAPLLTSVHERRVAMTLGDPPGEATHWTSRDDGESGRHQYEFVQHLARTRLQPHRVRRLKLSRDPDFVPKLGDIVRLHVDPPAHAIVLSVDEKSHV